VSWAYAAGENRDSDRKVFCFFSSEKKSFLLLDGDAHAPGLMAVITYRMAGQSVHRAG